MTKTFAILPALAMAAMLTSSSAFAQFPPPPRPAPTPSKTPTVPPPAAPAPSYIIGADDELVINVWNEPKVSGPVIVRPDGKITLPVGKDIVAAGLTTEELKAKVVEELKKGYFQDPDVVVVVKKINSRIVFVVGEVNKPGPYALTGPMTVLQLITVAGGPTEFADKKNMILISATLKAKDGSPMSWKINYDDMSKGKNLAKYNIELRPGDQLIVK
jgi:polysaccharide export outer membrane protein